MEIFFAMRGYPFNKFVHLQGHMGLKAFCDDEKEANKQLITH